jgi:hypothetical protein
MQQAAEDGVAAFLFEFGIIADGVVFFHRSAAVNKAGFEDHTFGQRCFPAAGMAKQRYIFYMCGIKVGHKIGFVDV